MASTKKIIIEGRGQYCEIGRRISKIKVYAKTRKKTQVQYSWSPAITYYWTLMEPPVDRRTRKPLAPPDWSMGQVPFAEHDQIRSNRFCPKKVLGWNEKYFLHKIVLRSGIWGSLFGPNIEAISIAQEMATANGQSVDFLFLKQDGSLLPCEVKIAGSKPDSHGQLIRYMAAISNNIPTGDELPRMVLNHLTRIKDVGAMEHLLGIINKFLSKHSLHDKAITYDGRSGILLDTKFRPETLDSIDLLNANGFNIQAYEMACHCVKEADLTPPPDSEFSKAVFRMDLNKYAGKRAIA